MHATAIQQIGRSSSSSMGGLGATDLSGSRPSSLTRPAISTSVAAHPHRVGFSFVASRGQLIKQRLRVFEVGGVEAFGEPVVDFA